MSNNGTTTVTVSSSSNPLSAGTPKLIELSFNGTGGSNSASLYANGTSIGSGSPNSLRNVSRTNNYIGVSQSSSQFMNGAIAEVILYNVQLSPSQRTAVEAYLEARYGLQVNAPVISVGTGVYSTNQTVAISADPGAVIRYTVDGSTPTTSSPIYSSPFLVTSSLQLQAISVQPFGSSAIARSYIQIDPLTANLPHTGMHTWLKADFMPPSGGSVANLYDASGNGNDFAQPTGGLQPTWSSNVVNGKPAIGFSGSQYLSAPLLSTNDFSAGSSVFVVAKPSSIVNQGRFFDLGQAQTNNNIAVSELTSPSGAMNMILNNGTTAKSLASTSGVFSTGAWALGEAVQGAGAVTFFKNGGTLNNGTLNNANNVSRTSNWVGSDPNHSLIYQGNIAEILLYNTLLSSADRANVEAYLFSKYAVAFHTPTISTGSYSVSSGNQSVTISSIDPNVPLYYTLDGSTPSLSSIPYAGAFTVNTPGTTTIKAAAIVGSISSSVATSTVQIDPATAPVPRNGLVSWFKGDLGITFGSGSNVAGWADVSGNGNDAGQAASAKQPSLVAGAINGLPALAFNGSSNFMTFGDLNGFSNGISIFVVSKETTATANSYLLSVGQGSSSNPYACVFVSNTSGQVSYTVRNSSSATTIAANGAMSISQYGLLEITEDSSGNGLFWVNGNSLGPSQSVNAIVNATYGSNVIGGSPIANALFPGRIAEILVYNRNVSTAERQSIEQYIRGRYGLFVSAPTISPGNGYVTVGSNPQVVTISGDADATIYYTTDGTNPVSSATRVLYTSPFSIIASTTVKAATIGVYGNSAVVSSVIQIDPATADVPRNGLKLWLKGDSGVQTSGSSVTAWNDSSGNQTTPTGLSGQYPTFITNAVNGLPAVQFNGSTQFLGFPSMASSLNGLSVFTVTQPTSLGSGSFLNFSTVNTSTTNGFLWGLPNGSGAFFYNSTNSVPVNNPITSPSGLVSTSTYSLLEATNNIFSAFLYQNGNLVASSNSMSQFGNVSWSVGYLGRGVASSGYYSGRIAEVLMYDHVLNVLERVAVESYLLSRYNLVTPVTAPPTFSIPSGTLPGPSQIAIDAPVGSTVFLTTDGSTPTPSSARYTGPFTVSSSETVKAVAVLNSVSSPVAQATYTLDANKWPAPSATDPAQLQINLQLPAIAIPQ